MDTNAGQEAKNVLTSVVFITAVIMVVLLVVLWFITKDIYLDLYYLLETLFDAPNVAASFDLATIAFSGSVQRMLGLTGIVIVAQLSRVLFISFIIAAVLDMIVYSNIDAIVNRIRAMRLRNHVIICGYSPLAENLIMKLSKEKKSFVVVEHDRKNMPALETLRALTILGNYAEESVLKSAGIANAKAILFTSQDDFENIIGALTAKKMNTRIKVLTRAGREEVRKKMYRIGVDMCVLPEYLAGIEMGEKMVDVIQRMPA